MRKKQNSLYIISFHLVILIISLTSCSKQSSETYEYYDNFFQSELSSRTLQGTKAIYIIPNGGCDGCITTAEAFARENASTSLKSLLIIFTGFTSLKNLQLKLPEIVGKPNVIFDQADIFYKGKLMSIYPTIVLLNHGKVIDIIEQSPDNSNSLSILQNHIRL